jgi:type II secretory pathway pseudopilin PulG
MSNKNNNRSRTAPFSRRGESGFTLVEAVIAIFILTIGLVGTAAAITYALQYGAISRNVTKAKLMVVASFEEIESLRNSRRLDYKQIANVGGVDNEGVSNPFNGFSTGFRQIPGNPGPDGVYGTADDITDTSPSRNGFSRQITISNISSSIKKIEVKVRYPGSGETIGEITGVSYLNDEARMTR